MNSKNVSFFKSVLQSFQKLKIMTMAAVYETQSINLVWMTIWKLIPKGTFFFIRITSFIIENR